MQIISRINANNYSYPAASVLLKEAERRNSAVTVGPTYTNIVAHGLSTSNQIYGGACNLRDGRVFAACSTGATQNTIFNINTGTLTLLTAHGLGTTAFCGCHQIDNDWVFLSPASADFFARQNIYTGETRNIGAGHGLTGVPFLGSCRATKNGRPVVVMCPSTATNVYYVYLDTLEYVVGPALTGKQWVSLLPGGNRVLFGTNLAVLDLDTDTITTTGTSNLNSDQGLVLTDGSVLAVANAASACFTSRFDGTTITTATRSPAFSPSGSAKFGDAALLPNGDVVLVPRDYATFAYWRPSTGVVTLGPTLSGTNKFARALTQPNGKVVCVPNRHTHFGVYSHFGATNMVGAMPSAGIAGPFWS